jgi:hypothetical protein
MFTLLKHAYSTRLKSSKHTIIIILKIIIKQVASNISSLYIRLKSKTHKHCNYLQSLLKQIVFTKVIKNAKLKRHGFRDQVVKLKVEGSTSTLLK